MINKVYNGTIPLWHFENLSKFPEIFQFVTSRKGGLSSGRYASFNLGYTAGEKKEVVQKNRQILADTIGIARENIITVRQSHSNEIRMVGPEDKASGPEASPADAMITDIPGKCLTIVVADCVPILLYDPARKVIAAVHAGWRGTVKKITAEAVRVMKEKLGCASGNIIAAIGPSIGPCCYEIGQDVIEMVARELGSRESLLIEGDKVALARFDLWEANRRQLIEAGVKYENIENPQICTSDNTEHFYSYRKEKDGTGRFMAGIMLR